MWIWKFLSENVTMLCQTSVKFSALRNLELGLKTCKVLRRWPAHAPKSINWAEW